MINSRYPRSTALEASRITITPPMRLLIHPGSGEYLVIVCCLSKQKLEWSSLKVNNNQCIPLLECVVLPPIVPFQNHKIKCWKTCSPHEYSWIITDLMLNNNQSIKSINIFDILLSFHEKRSMLICSVLIIHGQRQNVRVHL